jgi:hypothetical protein
MLLEVLLCLLKEAEILFEGVKTSISDITKDSNFKKETLIRQCRTQKPWSTKEKGVTSREQIHDF